MFPLSRASSWHSAEIINDRDNFTLQNVVHRDALTSVLRSNERGGRGVATLSTVACVT
jgi:hypothetical protein